MRRLLVMTALAVGCSFAPPPVQGGGPDSATPRDAAAGDGAADAAGGLPDAGTPLPDSNMQPPPDAPAAPPPDAPPVSCPGSSCGPGCCEGFCSGGGMVFSCSGTYYECDGPEDCGGHLCCNGGGGSFCATGASCGAAETVCHDSGDCSDFVCGCYWDLGARQDTCHCL